MGEQNNEKENKPDLYRQSSISVSYKRNSSVTTFSNHLSGAQGTIQRAATTTQSALNKQGDSGTSTVSTGISSARITVKTFNAAQDVTPYAVKSVEKVVTSSYKVIRSADSTIGMLRVGHITTVQIGRNVVNSLKSTPPAQAISKAASNIKGAAIRIKKGANATYVVGKGIIRGDIKVRLNKESLLKIKRVTIKSAKIVGYKSLKVTGKVIKVGAKSTASGIKHSVKGVSKGAYNSTDKLGKSLMDTNDFGKQSLGLALKTIHATPKVVKGGARTAKFTYKTARGTISTTAKVGKGIVKAGDKTYKNVKTAQAMVKTFGKKSTTKFYSKQAGKGIKKAFAKAGNSAVTMVMNFAKQALGKALIPVIIVIVCAFLLFSLISTPVSAVSSLFSGWGHNKTSNSDFDEKVYLTDKITEKRNSLVNSIKDVVKDNSYSTGGYFHYVRFYNSFTDEAIDLSENNILNSIYSVSEYYQYIQPVFNSLLLSKYELEATDDELDALFNEIWDVLTKISLTSTNNGKIKYDSANETISVSSYEIAVEYCTEKPCPYCGKYHADLSRHLSDGMDNNLNEGTHDNYSCPICDSYYYTCNGHEVESSVSDPEAGDSEPTETYYCFEGQRSTGCSNSTQHFVCNGYHYCTGHQILEVSITMGSFNDLLETYFTKEIHELENKSTLTEDESKRLDDLKTYYEICLNSLELAEEEVGSGNGTAITIPTDISLTNLTSYAVSFVGNPYVWGGESLTTGCDCSGFTMLCYRDKLGKSLPHSSESQGKMGTAVSLQNAKPGDLVYWNDGHIAIYLGYSQKTNNYYIVHASNSKPYPYGGIKVSYLSGDFTSIRHIN